MQSTLMSAACQVVQLQTTTGASLFRHRANTLITIETGTMETRKLRVGQPISPDEFEALSDAQLSRLVPKAYREFFPGKDFCADGHFYLHDGTAWCFFKGDFLDD